MYYVINITDLPKREKRHANGNQTDMVFIDQCPENKLKQKCLLRQHGCSYAYDRICDTVLDVNGRESAQCK